MLSQKFYSRDAEKVAKALLGKVLVRKIGNKLLKSKIVETEAYYGNKDPASRACKNGDLRKVMENEAGTILVYGVHNNWLINFVTGKKGKAEAVLLRALEPLNFKERCNGPGLLCKALKIDKNFHNKCINDNLWIENPKFKDNFKIISSNRIGVSKDLSRKLRFFIKENKFVSRII